MRGTTFTVFTPFQKKERNRVFCGVFACSLDAYSALQTHRNRMMAMSLAATLLIFLLVTIYNLYVIDEYKEFEFILGAKYGWRALGMSNLINFMLFLGKQLIDMARYPDKVTVISARPKRTWINNFGRGRR